MYTCISCCYFFRSLDVRSLILMFIMVRDICSLTLNPAQLAGIDRVVIYLQS